ncbi:Lrp/AsnC ligand binding domain-containing protein [Blastococcus brunescens]|uniref:Lrp/AsnC ligand binding domain-containing protein n=1 Tax=Blastococcus brunescens TaxID=1564165 RepID=A0ABZ1BAS0_9ACTN|nr:Lrp/AsnC ligand binding domain-containing protein [Blastococcus sp. BMG 8361]WRL66679.1 Lrp/AsnC ligand binding domain-containing protein [Blastococcus sp. BMG 8361]
MVTGYGPDVDVAAAGFEVQAFVTLEIAQGALEDVQRDLEAIPGLLEAHATTGSGDVLCRVAASSNEGLQQILVDLNRSSAIVRSTSVVALSQLVPWRTLPLLESEAAPGAGRSAMNRPPDRVSQHESLPAASGTVDDRGGNVR